MSNLFTLLFVVCLVALVVGMIKPQLVVRWGEVEKRNRKSVLKYYGIGLIASFILFGVTSSNTKSTEEKNSSNKSNEVTQKKELTAEEKAEAEKAAAEKAAKEEEERVGYETGITYDQLARTPDEFKGKKTKFTGKVVKVMEGKGETELRIAVNNNYDTILYVAYKSDIINSRILENDNVTDRGKSAGILTYKSTMGGEISIPSMLVEKIDIN